VMPSMKRTFRARAALAASAVLASMCVPVALAVTGHPAGASLPGGLGVFVGYAEDKEINTPDPPSFPVPWAGAPNTVFLGGTFPGGVCGSLPTCYDAGAIRLDNPASTPVVVDRVDVDDHSSVTGGKVFKNVWGSFTVPPHQSVILTENPPNNNPTFDNFDTSSYPDKNCTPLTVAPTVTITIAGVPTTLADSTHVLDSGGIDAGSCTPKRNESIQWRAIGSAGSSAATLTLGPATVTRFAGGSVTETASILDGSGAGLPNVTVRFDVTSGPDAGLTQNAVTDSSGHASFTYSGPSEGEDVVLATVSTVGSFRSNAAEVMWTDDSSAWNAADIGGATPAGSQSFAPLSGSWTVSGGGSGLTGASDQFHFVWQNAAADVGIGARVQAQTNTSASAPSGVMLRASTDPHAPYYAAFVTPGTGITVEQRTSQGSTAVSIVNIAGATPAYLWVTDIGATLATYASADGYVWQRVSGSSTPSFLGSQLLAGLVVASNDVTQLSQATFDSIVLSGKPPAPAPPIPCPGPWTCADIGNPTPPGSQSFDPNTGTWSITAGGTDINGTSDQFRFVWQSFTGDATVAARVATVANLNTASKAGVMLRGSTDPGSPYYGVVVTPGQGIKVQQRSTQGGTTVKLANPAGTVPAYLEVTRAGSTFKALTSSDGANWSLIPGSTFTMNLGATLLEGLALTSHNNGVPGTATMDSVTGTLAGPSPTTTTTTTTTTSSTTTSTSTTSSTTTTVPSSTTSTTSGPPLPCPAPWTCADIGSPALAGTQSFDPGSSTWTLVGGGVDITGTADQFHFVWQSLTGDGSVSAHVITQTNSSTNAKAGVMLRASTDAGAPNYAVLVSPSVGIKVQVRSVQGGTTVKVANPTGTVPVFLKVTRSGSTFTAYTSPDDTNWSLIPGSTAAINGLGGTLLAGLADNSHNAGALCTVTMDTVAVG
jgi:hypothetical protein